MSSGVSSDSETDLISDDNSNDEDLGSAEESVEIEPSMFEPLYDGANISVWSILCYNGIQMSL